MADDREPPALFDDDVYTQETKSDEAADNNPFNIEETTEITLDGGETNEGESATLDDKGVADNTDDEKSALLGTDGAASVDVLNLSIPSEDESKLPSKEKPEVCFFPFVLPFGKFLRCASHNGRRLPFLSYFYTGLAITAIKPGAKN